MAKRRLRGDAGLFQIHDHPTCPPIIWTIGDGKRHRTRPEHRCLGRWVGQVYTPGSRTPKRVTGRTATDVQVKLRKLQDMMGRNISPTTETLAQWLDYWLAEIQPHKLSGGRPLHASSVERARSAIDVHIKPAIGHVPLQSMSRAHVRQLLRKLDTHTIASRKGKQLATNSKRRIYAVLRAALEDAVRDGKLLANPAALVEVAGDSQAHHARISDDDATRLLSHVTTARDRARLILVLSGLRQGEALGLTWADITDDGVVAVRRSVRRQRTGGIQEGPVKTIRSNRVLPLPPGYAHMLNLWRIESGGEGWVFPGRTDPTKPEDARRDYDWWKALLASAGVPYAQQHGVRKVVADRLKTVDVHSAAAVLGHDPRVLLAVYQSEEVKRTAAALEVAALPLPALDG